MSNVTAALPRRMLADFSPAIYQSVMSAIVRVLAADNIDNSAKQSWQKLIDSKGANGSYRTLLSARDQFDYDCCLHALLHRELSAAHWNLLVGKFSTSTGNRVGSIGRTIPRISSPAPSLFIYKATTVWFIPKMKGKQGKRSTDIAILPDEFYDMNTWDVDARPDSTRTRWRRGIHKCLEALEEAAVIHVTEILEREQLIY
ncbi:hypothetical protein PSCICO_47050 [Pseudomonas cichorii]|uniref:hypothetical protein n=1 Tax=Pseudomonas cichorii TaxID=36746 RepID=UPI001910E784|nr:hypothetical protein [Pseudomonas cichorii]GFM89306.1 hypothetical protein PSCICO_47050 [Pseudomonas cichorii]